MFLQRRHTKGQSVHEKMLNITNYQKNANQNYYEADLGKRLVLNAWRQPEELECGVAATVGVCRSVGLPQKRRAIVKQCVKGGPPQQPLVPCAGPCLASSASRRVRPSCHCFRRLLCQPPPRQALGADASRLPICRSGTETTAEPQRPSNLGSRTEFSPHGSMSHGTPPLAAL